MKNESISLENRQKSLKKEKEKNNFPIFSLVTDDGNLNYNLNLSNIYERKPCEDSSQYIKKNKPSFSDDKEKPFKEKEKLGKRILIEKEKSPIKVKLPYQFKLDLSTLKKSD